MLNRYPYRIVSLLLVLLLCMFVIPNTSIGETRLSATKYREDINGDGKLNITDVIALLILGRDNPEDLTADYNGNGEYAVNDAIALLLNILNGNLTPVEEETYIAGQQIDYLQGLSLAYIPAGSFIMGDNEGLAHEMPEHEVTLDAFWMGTTEIPQHLYERVIGTNPSGILNEENPVEHVSWYDAVIFCNKLSELLDFESCYDLENWDCDFSRNGFRLPTEAEWEYACRAGTTTKYCSGDLESDLDFSGWYLGNSNGGLQQPIATKSPNNWNLYDMHGNVFEWCQDKYGSDYYSVSPVDNPRGPETGSYRVLRSGCACSVAFTQRSSNREFEVPVYGSQTIGIRVVRRP